MRTGAVVRLLGQEALTSLGGKGQGRVPVADVNHGGLQSLFSTSQTVNHSLGVLETETNLSDFTGHHWWLW